MSAGSARTLADRVGRWQRRSDQGGTYALYFIGFTVQLGMGIVSPILPDIMREFSLAAWQIGMVVTIFGLARLAVDLPVGFLLAKLDRAKILIAGTLLIVAGSIMAGTASDYGLLLLGRLVMGMGSATCTVTTLASLSEASSASSRGRVIGIYQAAMLGGQTFSPALGGFAATLAGWRASFFFCASTGLVATLLVMAASSRGLLRIPSSRARRKDRSGAAPTGDVPRTIPWDLVAINFTSMVFFASSQGFRSSMVPLYGGTALGIGAGVLGLLLGGSAVIRFVITLLSGFLSDRYGRKIILFPGIAFLAIGSLSFALASDLPGFAICLLILSLGGFGNSIPTTMVVDVVPASRVGMAISTNRFVGDLGVLIGPVLLGWILDTAGFTTVAVFTAFMLVSTVPGVAITFREKRRTADTAATRT